MTAAHTIHISLDDRDEKIAIAGSADRSLIGEAIVEVVAWAVGQEEGVGAPDAVDEVGIVSTLRFERGIAEEDFRSGEVTLVDVIDQTMYHTVVECSLHQRQLILIDMVGEEVIEAHQGIHDGREEIVVGDGALQEGVQSTGEAHHGIAGLGEAATVGIDMGIFRVQYIPLRIVEPGIDQGEFRPREVGTRVDHKA